MSRRMSEIARRGALYAVPAAALLIASAGWAQEPAAASRIVSHEVRVSRDAAMLKLELADGRLAELGLNAGAAQLEGSVFGAPGLVKLGPVATGSDLDRAWRELLNEIIEAPAPELPRLLQEWSFDSGAGKALDQALETAVSGVPVAPAAPDVPAPISDSLVKLQERIAELEAQRAELDSETAFEGVDVDVRRAPWEHQRSRGPFHYLGRGLAGIFSVLMVYLVLFAIGLATIFFGGRKYIEGVADTARHATLRSFLVGVAGAFLTLPAFVLGIIALAVSIVGIPALLLWVPLFPLAVVAALVLGYLAVAHAGGEALAERRLYGSEWFQRGNSYYFLLSGLGLLLAFYIGSAVVTMGGPWLGFISGLLKFFAVMVTWAAFSIGFGAVLLSRAGTRPLGPNGQVAEPDLFTDADDAGAA